MMFITPNSNSFEQMFEISKQHTCVLGCFFVSVTSAIILIIFIFIYFCFEVKAAHPKNNMHKHTHTIIPLCHDKTAFDVVEAEQSRVTRAQRGRRYLLSECALLTGAVLFGETAAAGGTSLLFDLFQSL